MWNISSHQLPIAVAVIIFYMISYFLLGSCITKRLKREEGVIPFTVICGMFLYFLLFEIIALPMKIQGISLTTLAYTWGIVLGALDLVSLLVNRNYLVQIVQTTLKREKGQMHFWIGIALLLVIQLIYIYGVAPEYMGVRDDYYYIGEAATSLYKNSIQQYDYITGAKLEVFNYAYFIPMYPMQGTAVCRLTGLHPAVENKISAVFVMFMVNNMIYYLFTSELLKERKRVLTALALIALLNFNLQSNGVTAAIFYFYRIAEGKGILNSIILPFVVFLFYELQKSSDNLNYWGILFLTILSSYSIVMSSMFLLPVSLSGLLGALLLTKRKWKYCIHAAICMAPCMIFLVLYELMSNGYIMLTVK